MMTRKMLKRLQAMNHKVGSGQMTEVQHDVLSTVKKYLDSKTYRADLKMVTASKSTVGAFSVEVKFAKRLGHPTDTDLMAIVAQDYPKHQIDWNSAEVDPEAGVIVLNLEPSVEMIPVESVKSIPAEFVSIGTGIYKRAADTTGKVQEIWSLKKNEDGLALYRNHDDLEVTADDESGFKAGDVVQTPYGPGKILRFDDLGNAFVTVGKATKLVASEELGEYDIDKERGKLKDYYAQVYGESFANELVKSTEQIINDAGEKEYREIPGIKVK